MRILFFLFSLLLFIIPSTTHAQVAISEVMWMGSDLSTSDEWLEITLIPCVSPCDDDPIDLSSWRLTYLNSKNEEALILRFATGTFISQGVPIVIASRSSANSRLLAEPAIVTNALTLPNTKLLLRLYDASGSLIDTVDDGVGTPFAGANPSGTGAKASMERIDLKISGNIKENWKTAETSSGFDVGFSLLGTPGSLGVILQEDDQAEGCSDLTGEENHCDTTVIQTGAVVTGSSSSQASSTGILISRLASEQNESTIKDACKVSMDGSYL